MRLPVRKLADKVRRAEGATLSRYRNKNIDEEPAITADLAHALESQLNGNINGFAITSKVLKASGKNSEERRIGADLLVVVEIRTSKGIVQKAFLAQAKKGSLKGYLHVSKDQRLYSQCDKMLAISSDSFVLVYTSNGFFMTPAFHIRNARLHRKALAAFFQEFFACYIGDHKILPLVSAQGISIPNNLLDYASVVLTIAIESKDAGDETTDS